MHEHMPSADDVLRQNLERLLEHAREKAKNPDLSVRAWVLGLKLTTSDVRNVQRILNGTQSPTLKVLDRLARAFELSAWQILTLNLDPSNPPVVHITKAERDFYASVRTIAAGLPDLTTR